MLLNRAQKNELDNFLKSIRLKTKSKDQNCKINQILAFLEIIQSQIRKLSYKRKLVFIDSGAGNCYLSFLVYYFYTYIDKRNITIYCIDSNIKLMENCKLKAKNLNFTNMHFHGCEIHEFSTAKNVDLVYSLHACDTATDQALSLGIRLNTKDHCCPVIKHNLALNSIVYNFF